MKDYLFMCTAVLCCWIGASITIFAWNARQFTLRRFLQTSNLDSSLRLALTCAKAGILLGATSGFLAALLGCHTGISLFARITLGFLSVPLVLWIMLVPLHQWKRLQMRRAIERLRSPKTEEDIKKIAAHKALFAALYGEDYLEGVETSDWRKRTLGSVKILGRLGVCACVFIPPVGLILGVLWRAQSG